jgi:hypothetical protein
MTTPTLSDSRRNGFAGNAIAWRPLTQDCVVAQFDQLPGYYGIELVDQPNPAVGVTIAGYTEIFTGAPNAGEYIVDYASRLVRFNSADDAAAVTAVYEGKGSPVSVKHLPNLTTKGDLLGHDGTKLVRLPVGSNGQVLKADSTQASGLTWGAGGGGGTAGKNYVVNPDGESDAANWTAGTNISVSRTTTAGEVLRGTGSIKISANGSVLAGAYVYASLSAFDLADRNRMLSLEFEFKGLTGYDSGDCELRLYDGTVEITPSIAAVPGGQGKFVATFVSTDSSSAYQLRFKSTVASAWDLVVDDVSAGPGFVMPGAAIEDAILDASFAPAAGFGTVTNQKIYRKRSGDFVRVYGFFTSGTVAASEAHLVLPSSIQIDFSKLTTVGGVVVGFCLPVRSSADEIFGNASVSSKAIVLFVDGTDSSRLFFAHQTGGSDINKMNANALFTSSEHVSFYADFPVVNWGSSTQFSSSRVEYVFNSTVTDADDTTAFGYGEAGGLIPSVSAAARKKRVRFSRRYKHYGFEIQPAPDRPWIPMSQFSLERDSGGNLRGAKWEAVSGTDVDAVFAASGTLDIPGTTTSWATHAGNSARWRMWGSDNPIPVETGSKGFLAATSSVKTPGASGDYLAMTGSSLALLPGEWSLKGMARYRDNGSGPGYSQEEQGWYAANGADSASEPAALSTVCEVQAGSGTRSIAYMGSLCDVQLEEIRVRVSSPTTVYLVPRPSASSPSNARVTTYLYAERIS